MTINEEHLNALVQKVSQPIITSIRESLYEMQAAQLAFQREIAALNRVAYLKAFSMQLHTDLAIQLSLEAINLTSLLNPEVVDNIRQQILTVLTNSSEAMLLEAQRQAVAEGYSEMLEELARQRDAFLTDLQKRLSITT